MKKIILPALICSAIFANLANAEDISKPTSTPGNYDPTSVKDVIKDEVGLKKRKKKKVQVSDAVKKLNKQKSIEVKHEMIKSADHFFSNNEQKVIEKIKKYIGDN